MSFDIKYDRDGKAIKQPEVQAQLDEAANREVPVSVESSVRDEMSQSQEEKEVESSEVVEVEETQEPEVIQEKPISKPIPPQESFKVMREKAEKAEKRAQEAELLLKQYAAAKIQPVAPEPEEDNSFSIDEDSLVEGKDLSRVHKEVVALRKQLKQQQQETYIEKVKTALKTKYQDWDNVFNDLNMAHLEEKYPEIYHTLSASTDPYKSGVAAYTMIKKLGVSEPEDRYVEDKALAQKNAAKPRNTASISPQSGDSPLSKVNAFATGNIDDSTKAQLWKEINQYRR